MTFSYLLMLLFVFWTLFKLAKLYYVKTASTASYTNGILALFWSALGTNFFYMMY